MTSATESHFRMAERILPRIFRAGVGAIGRRRERQASARALSAMDDHMLKDIGVTRLEITFGRLRSAGGRNA
jgi:uncharacterized protein YjiS (DUF1127 family)